jgi:hypothetical protein
MAGMIPEFTREQSNALSDGPQIEMIDPVSGRTFVVIEKTFYTINHHEQNVASIQRGVDEIEAGGGISLEASRQQNMDRLTNQFGE